MSTIYSASLTRHIIGAYHKQSITKWTVDDMYVLSLKEELSPHALQAGDTPNTAVIKYISLNL